MVSVGTNRVTGTPRYAGLRMGADEYLALVDDGFRYELVHGVVVMSPSPTYGHQQIARRVLQQIGAFADSHRLGEVVGECDVRLAGGLVYRPDVMFHGESKLARRDAAGRPIEPPDIVVEVESPSTRSMDLRTKKDDYERAGVREYWVIGLHAARQFVLERGVYVEREVQGERVVSVVLAGCELDLQAVRRGVVGE